MNLQETIDRIKEMMGVKEFTMLPMDNIRRPNGSVGTQGFTPESMLSLMKHISNVRGLNLPEYESLKEMIVTLRERPDILHEIMEYVKTDPIEVTKLPDDSYHLNDGNHRANLLNLLYATRVPAIVK
jgi:SH3-like domain-containing protein